MISKHRTIKDVAAAAGVSTQTVSRVINNRPDVASDTRARVRQIIAELGYEPNVIARSLGRGQSHTLGVIGYGLEYFGSTSILRGIERKATELGYSLFLSLINEVTPDQVEKIIRDMLSRRVDGLIWTVPSRSYENEWLEKILKSVSIPLVYLNKLQSGNDLIAALDNHQGARLAVQHLFDQGYQRIGIITGPGQWWEAQERESGWRETLIENEVANIEALKVEGDWNAPSGEAGMNALLTRNPDLDAVFVCNDQMALGALQAARTRGRRVPDDLGIVGFDDIPEAAFFYPPLTTVHQNAQALGALAMEVLCAGLSGGQDENRVSPGVSWIEPHLVIRQSSLRTHQ